MHFPFCILLFAFCFLHFAFCFLHFAFSFYYKRKYNDIKPVSSLLTMRGQDSFPRVTYIKLLLLRLPKHYYIFLIKELWITYINHNLPWIIIKNLLCYIHEHIFWIILKLMIKVRRILFWINWKLAEAKSTNLRSN